jgi:predicted helicase
MPLLQLAANHKPVTQYYLDLKHLSLLHATHEGAVRGAFQTLLQQCARQFEWTVIAEYAVERPKRPSLRVDGAVVDSWKLVHGYWEAKDEHDDLKEEVKKKLAKGYPVDNILFQAPDRAILYQDGRQVLDESLKDPKKLVEVLKEFFRYEPPAYAQWELAVEEFKTRVPELARALVERIHEERKLNSLFRDKFGGFVQTCRQAINPNLSEPAVEEMLIQHMLTERIFRKVFANPDFARRNAIAGEIESVVDALTKRSFNRDKFLSGLERFYGAIEKTAGTIESFTEKQGFLNTVYEKFFQGFSVKVADTHGIVYTPQSIVRFMVRGVDEILEKEFGRSLGSKGVHILDPFLGTGNFLLHVMRQIPRTQLAYKYEHELHGNEVMLLPYYIAAMNIEHEYSDMMGEYKPFDGLCLVDTFELAEAAQPVLFTAQNTARVEKQRRAPIFVILGNPPYNAWQTNEGDNNKNQKHPTVDRRVTATYAADSSARLMNSLQDPYIKAIRWATDKIGSEGIVAFVTNNSFVEGYALDGVRKHLARDFDAIYVLDLGGNVRKNPELSGTTHNVFGIQVGVSISFFVRKSDPRKKTLAASVRYAATEVDWRKEEKYKFLDGTRRLSELAWVDLAPDAAHTWIRTGLHAEYANFLPVGPKAAPDIAERGYIFSMGSNGMLSGRDAVAYNFLPDQLELNIRRMVDEYAAELSRYARAKYPADIDKFLIDSQLKWSRNLKRDFARGQSLSFEAKSIRAGSYRPFTKVCFYFGESIIDEEGQFRRIFPDVISEAENICICCAGVGNRKSFGCLALRSVPARDYAFEKAVVFPFYSYDRDGSNRRENITDWALAEFRAHYADSSITKLKIFHYVYGLLHHPAYRDKYKVNLKRELPRIPYAPDFRAFVEAGKQLAEMHLDYEEQPEYPLNRVEDPEQPLSWRVEKMRLGKHRDGIVYNDFLTLTGIPPEVFEYRLGNRSALEWLIDQYQIFTDKRSGIVNDPNRQDDPEYIVRLIGQVITVSLETVKIIRGLPPCEEGGLSAEEALSSAGAPPADEAEPETPPAQPSSVQKRSTPVPKAEARGAAAKGTARGSKAKAARGTKARQ